MQGGFGGLQLFAYVIILQMPFDDLLRFGSVGQGIRLKQVLLALALPWLVREMRSSRAPKELVWAYVVFLASVIVSMINAGTLSLSALAGAGVLVFPFLLFLLGFLCVRDILEFKRYSVVLAFTALIASIFALFQFVLERLTGTRFFLIEAYNIFQHSVYRAPSFFRETNVFADYVAVAALPAIGFLSFRMRQLLTRGERIFLLVALGFSLIGQIISASRQTWVGLFIAGVALAILYKRVKNLIVAVVAVVVVGFLATSFSTDLRELIIERSTVFFNPSEYEEESSLAFRLMNFQSNWEIFERAPTFGIGYGNLKKQYFTEEDFELGRGTSSNVFLDLAVEIGVVGLMCFLFFWIVVMWGWRRSFALCAEGECRVVLGVGLSIVVYFFVAHQAMGGSIFYDVFWMTSGMAIRAARNAVRGETIVPA
jgi:hypothetical protein